MGCASRLYSLRRCLTGSAVLLSSLPRNTHVPGPPSSCRPLLPLPLGNRSNLFTLKPAATATATPFLGLSVLSTFSAAGVDVSEQQSPFSHEQQNSMVSEFSEQIYISVKAYFLCTSIDLKSLQVENAYNVLPPASRSSNYLVLRFCDIPPEVAGFGVLENGGCYRYMVVFQYGSAVLFNIVDNDVEIYLELVRRHASGLLPEMRKDDYAVVQKPQLETWMQGGLDYIVLKSLDIDGIRIIGSVLGQSIALDYFVRQVDGMVEEFTDINRGMEKTGTFTMQRKKLFQLVGRPIQIWPMLFSSLDFSRDQK